MANVTVSNGALYAVLGLVGGFTGSWSNLPYYYKVREYNNFEARDLWSYDLNLRPDEVALFNRYNREYQTRFGFPFVICARENKKASILAGFKTRLHSDNERFASRS